MKGKSDFFIVARRLTLLPPTAREFTNGIDYNSY